MSKKITYANEDAKFRLSVIRRVLDGETAYQVAKDLGNIEQTTVRRWVRQYNAGGVERLNAPRKPRPKREPLDAAEIVRLMESAPAYAKRLSRLLRLAHGEQLKQIAADTGVSVQSIMMDRRLYEQGKLPLTVII